MKRAIYIGKALGDLRYGVTGTVNEMDPWTGLHRFRIDGSKCDYWSTGSWILGYLVTRKNFYIPSEDQTRHCTKP